MKYHNFITKLAVIFILLLLNLGCDKDNSSPEENHPPVISSLGDWSATTSQNYPISFKVEDVGGIVGVTEIDLKIDCQGTGWSATIGGTITFSPPVEIVNGKFDYSSYNLNFDGTFNNPPTLSGELDASSAHPQGLGTAYGSATYSATKL